MSMSKSKRDLETIRAQLDALDEELVGLMNRRADLARKIGQAKASAGMRVYAPDRERQVLERVSSLNCGPMSAEALRSVYRELMSASLALERSPRIALLGPPGSYSHLAGRRKFGTSVEFEIVSTITAVFDLIERGHAEFGLVPVENSIAGGVGETLDALIARDLRVNGELNLAVHHHLLSRSAMETIERVYSKPEVFAQCQNWLQEMRLSDKVVAVASTSAAAEIAAREEGAAAIAGDLAAELYELTRIAEFVEDHPGNITRFLILGTSTPNSTGDDKTSIVFSVGHQPGHLVDALSVFRDAGLNMTRIESRPDRWQRWTYYFFIDIEGHAETAWIKAALAETAGRCSFWKVLGSYPRSPEVV